MLIRHLMAVGAGVILLAALTPPVRAQRAEVSVEGGYSLSEGVRVTNDQIFQGQIYDQIDITSGGTWGVTVGFFVSPQLELEFLYNNQFSTLEANGDGGAAVTIGDLNVRNYHGNIVYNYGESDAMIRPFVFGGIGATHYAPGDPNPSIQPLSTTGRTAIDSETQFSTNWGGGVKVYPSPNVGVRLTGRWTPTYIKSDAAGLWCDPFYPTCWVVGDPDYSNQFELSGGVTLRF